jgi:hypothetical protein
VTQRSAIEFRPRAPRWCAADFRALGRHHGIEGGCELGGAIADQQARPHAELSQLPAEVACLLRDPT